MTTYYLNAYKVMFETRSGEQTFYNLRLVDEKDLAAESGLFDTIQWHNIEQLLKLGRVTTRKPLEVCLLSLKLHQYKENKKNRRYKIRAVEWEQELKRISCLVRDIGKF